MAASTAIASHNSTLAQRENLRPVSIDLQGQHSRHVENRPPAPPAVHAGTVKFLTSKNYCYLKLADGRDAFLHQDDYDGDWPPPYMKTVVFERLIDTKHPKNRWRAKEARRRGTE
jgi:hypothetical protein